MNWIIALWICSVCGWALTIIAFVFVWSDLRFYDRYCQGQEKENTAVAKVIVQHNDRLRQLENALNIKQPTGPLSGGGNLEGE